MKNVDIFEGVGSYFATYQILKSISKKYEDMEIYKLGIIDKNGIVDYDKLKSSPELDSKFTLYDRLIIGIKKIFKTFNKNKTLTFAVLLKFLYGNLNESYIDVEILKEELGVDDTLNISDKEVEINYKIVEEYLDNLLGDFNGK